MELNLSEIVYNHEYKEAFIETLENDKYKEQAMGVFRKTKPFEEELGKDIFDMRPSELNDTIKSLRFTGFNPAIRDVGLINKYNLWAQANGHCTNNAIKIIDTSHKNLKKYYYRNFNSVYSYEDILQATKNMPARLGLIVELIFHGFKGATALNEIRYLKVEDLHEDNGRFYAVVERGELDIPEDLYHRLIRFNSMTFDTETGSRYLPSKHIFKQIDRGDNIGRGEVVRETIGTSAVANLKQVLNDKTVTMSNLRYSGFNYYAYQLMQKSGEMILTKDILKVLSVRYKIGMNNSGFCSYKTLLDWIFEDKIKEFYGDFEVSDEL